VLPASGAWNKVVSLNRAWYKMELDEVTLKRIGDMVSLSIMIILIGSLVLLE
jgi:hypothetical protein